MGDSAAWLHANVDADLRCNMTLVSTIAPSRDFHRWQTIVQGSEERYRVIFR